MKSIYDPGSLRCNAKGLAMKDEAEAWFKSMMEKYPDYNPREMTELFSGGFSLQSARRILELRKSGVLKEK